MFICGGLFNCSTGRSGEVFVLSVAYLQRDSCSAVNIG